MLSIVEPDTELTLMMQPFLRRSASKQAADRWKAEPWLVACSALYSASVYSVLGLRRLVPIHACTLGRAVAVLGFERRVRAHQRY